MAIISANVQYNRGEHKLLDYSSLQKNYSTALSWANNGDSNAAVGQYIYLEEDETITDKNGISTTYKKGPYIVSSIKTDKTEASLTRITTTGGSTGDLDSAINDLKNSVNEKFESLSNALHFLGNAASGESDPIISEDDDNKGKFYEETVTETTTTVAGGGTTVETASNITLNSSYTISGKVYGGESGTPFENGDLVIQGKKEFVVVVSESEPTISTETSEDNQTTTTTKVTKITKTWSLLGDVTGVQDLLTWQEED